jgi:hypothetical protein
MTPDSMRLAPKWGFIVYRCTYRDDDAWHRFITEWRSMASAVVRRCYKDAESIMKSFDLKVIEDRATLEGASPKDVRARHIFWARSDPLFVPFSNRTAKRIRAQDPIQTRYDFCVHVDAAALQSCLEYIALPEEKRDIWPSRDSAPFVNVVTCQVLDLYGYNDKCGKIVKMTEEMHYGKRLAVRGFFPNVIPSMYCEIYEEMFAGWLAGRHHKMNGVICI